MSGTLQPRKNLERVVQAFEAICGRPELAGTQLVLAGRKGWLYEGLFARVEASGLSERVIFPGYVPDEDVPALLSAATAFVFPSLYEGFGIPVLEAGGCGLPVITSNTSSLPEVAGDAALLVDPHDVDAIAEAMYRIVTDPDLAAELTRRGHENVKRFSWEKCARETLAVLESVAAQAMIPSVRILGVRVDAIPLTDLLDCIAGWIAEGGPHQVSTVNPEFVMAARRNPEFARVLEASDLCIAGRRRAAVGRKTAGQAAARAGDRLGRRPADCAAGGGARVAAVSARRGSGDRRSRGRRAAAALSRAAGGRARTRALPRMSTRRRSSAAYERPGPTSCSWRTARRSRICGSRSTGPRREFRP